MASGRPFQANEAVGLTTITIHPWACNYSTYPKKFDSRFVNPLATVIWDVYGSNQVQGRRTDCSITGLSGPSQMNGPRCRAVGFEPLRDHIPNIASRTHVWKSSKVRSHTAIDELALLLDPSSVIWLPEWISYINDICHMIKTSTNVFNCLICCDTWHWSPGRIASRLPKRHTDTSVF